MFLWVRAIWSCGIYFLRQNPWFEWQKNLMEGKPQQSLFGVTGTLFLTLILVPKQYPHGPLYPSSVDVVWQKVSHLFPCLMYTALLFMSIVVTLTSCLRSLGMSWNHETKRPERRGREERGRNQMNPFVLCVPFSCDDKGSCTDESRLLFFGFKNNENISVYPPWVILCHYFSDSWNWDRQWQLKKC